MTTEELVADAKDEALVEPEGSHLPAAPERDDLCRCGHGPEWHDPCSKCYCPWFLKPDNLGPVKRWEKDRNREKRVQQREGK